MNLKSVCMHLVSERAKRHLSETATHSRETWDQRGKYTISGEMGGGDASSSDQLKEIIPIIYIF